MSKSTRAMNNCGCCDGTNKQTPVPIQNRSGLSAISYRAGDYSRFKQSMLSRLSSTDYPELADLKTRDDDDFSIALLDAWATVGDVLTFYQERIANESYLRTARERLSILEQARLVGYRLNPGVAASSYLAFTMEEAAGDSEKTTPSTVIDIGTRVQSTPGPGEKPQTYETIEEIEAHVAHNSIRPRLTQPQSLSADIPSIRVKGTNLNLRAGDTILLVLGSGSSDRITKQALEIAVDQESKTTCVYFVGQQQPASESDSPIVRQSPPGQGQSNIARMLLTASNVDSTIQMDWAQNDLLNHARIQKWPLAELSALIQNSRSQQGLARDCSVHVFRQRASRFGYNAPRYNVKIDGDQVTNPNWTLDENTNKIFLDRVYEELVPGTYAAVQINGEPKEIFEISSVETHTRTAYGLSSQTSLVTLEPYTTEKKSEEPLWKQKHFKHIDAFNQAKKFPMVVYSDPLAEIRVTTVDVQSEKLDLAEIPITLQVECNQLTLDNFYPHLEAGQRVVLTGEPVEKPGTKESEVLEIAYISMEGGFSSLRFKTSLQQSYHRDSVILYGNVALASHGETVYEILGNGDARIAFQQFILKQAPLTHVSAATAGGTASTLEVWVNDLLWQEVDNFYGRGPNEHIFITHINDNGQTSVQFGDGIRGARLPSGENNVRAKYRKGIGLEGMVDAKQLNLLMSKPLGLKEVFNPIAAAGGDDPETRDTARTNAPLTVLTIDRIVSLKDYENFARAFAGIAKAQAISIRDSQAKSVLLTVAAANGGSVEPGSNIYEKLSNALQKAGDPYSKFTLTSYRPVLFKIRGTLQIDPLYLEDKVLQEVKEILKVYFSFEKRAFGQPVLLSEVIALIHDISGVLAVDIDKLYRFGEGQTLEYQLNAGPAGLDENGELIGAELLTLDCTSLDNLQVLT